MTNKKTSQRTTSTSGQKDNQKRTIVTVLCTIVVTVIIMFVIMILFDKPFDNEQVTDSEKESSRNMVVMEDNVDEVISDITAEKTSPGRYQVTMNTTWRFIDGNSASSNAYVKNAEANTNAVYFDIVRSDTGENIFSSPILPVGSYLKNITLDTDLDKGEYECVLKYTLIDEEQNPVSSVSVNLNIVVEN